MFRFILKWISSLTKREKDHGMVDRIVYFVKIEAALLQKTERPVDCDDGATSLLVDQRHYGWLMENHNPWSLQDCLDFLDVCF